jgi:hypothetical protein
MHDHQHNLEMDLQPSILFYPILIKMSAYCIYLSRPDVQVNLPVLLNRSEELEGLSSKVDWVVLISHHLG